MIAVDHGYTLTEHAPTTYNYRYQNTPSPISRAIQLPVDQLNPLSATTTTGSPVFIANLSKDLSFLIDQIGTNTEISAYISRYCTAAYGAGAYFRAYHWQSTVTGKYDLNVSVNGTSATLMYSLDDPCYLAFVTEAVEINLRDSYGRPFDPYTRRGKTMLMCQRIGSGGQKTISRFYLVTQDYDSIDIEPSSTAITQQDYLYTVTGGVVT